MSQTTLIYGVTDEDLKHCVNRKCKRFGVPVYNQGKRCLECRGKLRRLPASALRAGEPMHIDDSHLADDERQAMVDAINDIKRDDNAKSTAPSQSQSRTGGQPLTVIDKPRRAGYASKNDTFTCDPDVDGKCPLFTKDTTPTALVTNEMFNLWVWLAKKFDTEWIAYLKGHFVEADNQWVIDSMYFPKQEANGAHCEAEDGEVQPDTIGAVHSHVGMGVFWSSEDKKHANHTVEFVVNRKSDLLCSIRTPLECGRYTRIDDCRVFLSGNDASQALARELETKITKKSYTYSASSGSGSSYGGGYNHSKECRCAVCVNKPTSSSSSSSASGSPNSGYRPPAGALPSSTTPSSPGSTGGTGTGRYGWPPSETPDTAKDPDIHGASSSYGHGMDWMA